MKLNTPKLQSLFDKRLSRDDVEFSESRYMRCRNFVEGLRHWKGRFAGKQFELSPWQDDIVKFAFGLVYTGTGLRITREIFLFIPRKNGKSFFAAALLLYLLADGDMGGECYSAATTRDQAKIVYSNCEQIVRMHSLLRKRTNISQKGIDYPAKKSNLRALASLVNNMDGLNTSGAVIDEIHAHRTRHLYDVIKTSTGSREEPMLINTTTAGETQEGICGELYEKGKQVLSGKLEDVSFLPVIYESQVTDDLSDSAIEGSNPNIGVSVSWEYLTGLRDEARVLPSKQPVFSRYHLNRWNSGGDATWLSVKQWDKGAAPQLINWDFFQSRDVYVGMDLSRINDLSSVSLLNMDDWGLNLMTVPFLPEDGLVEKAKNDGVPYDVWQSEGYLRTTPGKTVDLKVVVSFLEEVAAHANIVTLSYDPAFAFSIDPELKEIVGEEKLHIFRASLMNYTPACLMLETAIQNERIKHDGNPIMRWQVGVVRAHRNAEGLIKPDKKNRHTVEKIDGVVSSIIAISGYVKEEQKDKPEAEEIDYWNLPKII